MGRHYPHARRVCYLGSARCIATSGSALHCRSSIQCVQPVQREHDGRALNFYRKKNGQAASGQDFPLFETKEAEAPLTRLIATFEGDSEPLHATLVAVSGRAFCMSFSRQPPPSVRQESMRVTSSRQAWRSNVLLPDQAPNPSIKRTAKSQLRWLSVCRSCRTLGASELHPSTRAKPSASSLWHTRLRQLVTPLSWCIDCIRPSEAWKRLACSELPHGSFVPDSTVGAA